MVLSVVAAFDRSGFLADCLFELARDAVVPAQLNGLEASKTEDLQWKSNYHLPGLEAFKPRRSLDTAPGVECVCCNSWNFFLAVNACNKKIITSSNFFFAVSRVNPLHAFPQKKVTCFDNFFVHASTAKKIIGRDNFFVHAFAAKKKLHGVTIFFTRVYAKKNDTPLPQKQITRPDDFFVRELHFSRVGLGAGGGPGGGCGPCPKGGLGWARVQAWMDWGGGG